MTISVLYNSKLGSRVSYFCLTGVLVKDEIIKEKNLM